MARPWVFAPLAQLTAAGEIQPILAARVELLGPQRLRLWLRTDAKFEDGSPIRFDDVEASLARNKLKATLLPGETILVESEPGTPPEVLLSRTSIYRRDGDRYIGAGPFSIREQDAEHILLGRRTASEGLIERVLIRAYASQRDAFSHTLKGDAELLPEVDPRSLEFFEGVPRFQVVRAAGAHANVVAFNLSRLSRAERVSLSRVLASDELRVQAFGADCVAPAHRRPGGPASAGPALAITAIPIFDRFALAVRRTLGPRGAEIRLLDLSAYFTAVTKRDFDLILARPLVWPPSMATLIWRTGSPFNVLRYSNPRVDTALDERNWEAAQAALDDDPPAAFICTSPAIMIVDRRVKDPTATPDDLPRWHLQ